MDIVKIQDNQQIPADVVLLACSNPQGLAFVNTMNLDGETNLKERIAHESTKKKVITELAALNLELQCDLPNPSLYSWNCNLRTEKDWVPLGPAQLLLRGCMLKNTEFAIGMVVYTGHETKIMQNSKPAPSKMSHVMLTMNKMLYTIFVLQAIVCFVFAGLYIRWNTDNADTHTYLDISTPSGGQYFIQVLAFYVAYSHFVPISLYVMMEIVKLYLARLIQWDREMYSEDDDRPAGCRTSDLVEELGQVSFLFSDKTGTLTRNIMEFKKCAIAGHIYGVGSGEELQTLLAGDNRSADYTAAARLLTELSLCHSVFPTQLPSGQLQYQAASPDELALVEGASQLGFAFISKEDDRMTIQTDAQRQTYQIVAEVPFDSTRKRMSILVQDTQGHYMLMTKGADSIMLELLKTGNIDVLWANETLGIFAREGLRTLVIAQKALETEEVENWLQGWKSVLLSNAKNKAELINNQASLLEHDLDLVGVTAIEDKLQDGVPETIELLMKAEIRVWVLTGDKQETAMEIGKACRLLTPSMRIEDLSSASSGALSEKLKSLTAELEIPSDLPALIDFRTERLRKGSRPLGVVIDGLTLSHVLEDKELEGLFFQLGFVSDSCICCRVSPAQKAQVVKLVKNAGKDWVTLSIGDGANDVSMIQEAHIGVGIAGKEGSQAVQAADFSFSQFKCLQHLLLVHGRWNYRRISWFVCYYFYKNITVVFTELWFAIFNGFSSQIYFVDWLPQLYNSFWTSWPCMFTFVYERDLSAKQSLANPVAYGAGPRCLYFSFTRFWMWILFAIYHGNLCFWVPYIGFEKGIDSEGRDTGLWLSSTLSFTLIIHVVTYKLFLETGYWTVVNM
jgi:phospholipid-transporting ATPase